jgi:DEAD/DEAH box helicase domain-containing protein
MSLIVRSIVRKLVYLDIETQKGAHEVGGWNQKHAMGISVAVTYQAPCGEYRIYLEEDVPRLLEELRQADCVVGFNILDFDLKILEAYSVFSLEDLPCLDLMKDVEKRVGKRLGLEALVRATLGIGKTARGTDALRWWREGKLLEIARYCCFDVKATRLLHQYGARHGKVYFWNDRSGQREAVPVEWPL